MILFVFEGAEREPRIFKTLERLFFGKEERIFYSFGNNIYELYRQLKDYEGDGDLVSILRENSAQLPAGIKTSDFSEIFLFFDYDFQNINLSLEEMNERLREMLEMFDDETGNGKLYVSYPMVESLCYTKMLPDEHFVEYTIPRSTCLERSFKDLAREFSYYGNLDFVVLPNPERRQIGKRVIAVTRQNWVWLVQQHASKASIMCGGTNSMPSDKESVGQTKIFEAQLRLFLGATGQIAILNGIPLFLFEYFKISFWR